MTSFDNYSNEQRAIRIIDHVADSDLPDEAKSGLMESLSHAVSAMLNFEDRFWNQWGGVDPFGAKNFISLVNIKSLAEKGEEVSETNPLIRRGRSLKTDHATSYGFWFDFPEHKGRTSGGRTSGGFSGGSVAHDLGFGVLPPRWQKVFLDPVNVGVMFSDIAVRGLNDTVFAKGNAYRGYDVKSQRFYRVPLSQISNVLSDSSDVGLVKYYQRTYSRVDNVSTGERVEVVEWIPTDYQHFLVKNKIEKHPKMIDNVRVNSDHVLLDFSPNRAEGQVFGLPDCFAAVPWAIGYSEYLKDGQKLLSAYAAIAIQVKAKTRSEAEKIGAKVALAASHGGGKAGVVAGTEGFEVNAIGRTNAVDLLTGLPLLAQAASAMDLSRNNLSSFATEGGYGSATSISETEKLSAQARQRELSAFYERVFRLVGVVGELRWNRIVTDPVHRLAAAGATLVATGVLSRRELRGKAVDWLDIEGVDVDDLPVPDLFTGSKAASLPQFLNDPDNGDDDSGGDPVPRQGNSGVGGGLASPNQARDDDDTRGL